MTAMLAQYIDSIIMLGVGAYACAVGFGAMPAPSKDPIAAEQWRARYGKLLRIIGPLLVVIALILAGARYSGHG
jgi:hypothetical protein